MNDLSEKPAPKTDEIHIQVEPEQQENDQPELEAPVGRTLHIFFADDEPEEEPNIVKSIPLQPESSRATQQRKRLLMALVFCFFVMIGGIVIHLILLWQESATITIIPASQQVTINTTVTLTTGEGNTSHNQIPGRFLSSLTLIQEQTIKTTGVGHQAAQSASGMITFYNASLVAQTILAGTLLTGSDGVQVVTDQDVTIPAATYPTFGQATISGHALVAGPGGNIHAGDIYGPCCRANVSVVNGAFTGGQTERSYSVVTQQDIDTTSNILKAGLNQSIQAAFQAQIKTDETLLTPIPCTPKIMTGKKAGEEATAVTVTVNENCTGEAYNTATMMTLLDQKAEKQASAGYILAGKIQINIAQITQKQGVITIQIKGTGLWVYQFTQAELDRLSSQLAGKTEEQAKDILLHASGVQSVSINLAGKELPTDTRQIHFFVVQS